ncbi:MAG TPA: hypothetical protein PK142_03465 [bacterium]|nr:hypothetical protein [bacterium]
MKPKENHKKLWLISAVLLILTIILLVSGCLSNATEIKLLPEDPIIPLPIPKFFLINTPNWWNIVFLISFIFIFFGIIHFLERKNKNQDLSDFNHYEEEEVYLKDSLFLGIKIGSVVGLLGIFTVFINPLLTRLIAGIAFTSLAAISLIAIYDAGTCIIETNSNRIKNSIGTQIGSILTLSLLIGFFSCFRNGLTVGMGIFLTVFLSSIIITMSLTFFIIIIKTIRRRILNFFLHNK